MREQLTALEDENRRLVAELQTLRAGRVDLQRSEEAAKARIAALVQSLDEAAAEAEQLDQELAGVRWQNAQLATNLSRAEAARDSAMAETETVRAELQKVTEGADADRARLREQQAATAERLNDANAALIAAEQERDSALGQLDARQADADRLSEQLAVAEAQLDDLREQNRVLETRLAGLELSASAATDVARQNLLAVESQIEALNSTLATVELERGAADPGSATTERQEATRWPPGDQEAVRPAARRRCPRRPLRLPMPRPRRPWIPLTWTRRRPPGRPRRKTPRSR